MVEEHVASAVAAIVELAPSARAVYLSGGFGRGEGTVRQVGGQWIPLNDYDFIVMDDPTVTQREVGYALGRRLADDMGLDAVDIGWMSPANLPTAAVTMDNYDFRYGARLLWGEESRSVMPLFPEGALPVFELVRLLCNRAAGLLSATLPEHPNSADYAVVQVIKAGMALGDAVVAVRDQYHHLAQERLERFQRLAADGSLPEWMTPDAVAFVISAYQAKLLDPADVGAISPTRFSELLVHAFRMLVAHETGQSCEGLPQAEADARRCFGTAKGGVIRGVGRALRGRHWAYLFGSHFAMSRWVLISQIALFEAQGRGDAAMGSTYRRHFWWVPGAWNNPPNAVGTVKLWETFCHG